MDEEKRKRLERRGWKAGTVEEFLELSPEESAYIEVKIHLARSLVSRRKREKLNQVEAARRIGTSQSRLSKMEAADASVSLDLLVRSCLALGATPEDIARAIAG